MRVIMFQPKFADKVKAGHKCHTIRASARCQIGDLLSLRRWTGKPYRSKQEVIRETVCTVISVVILEYFGATINGNRVSGQDLAVCDGFKDWEEMRDWFDKVHGLPFTGFLICWNNRKESR